MADPVRNLIFFRAFFGPCMTIIVENFGTKTTHANHTWHDWHFFCRRHVAEAVCTETTANQGNGGKIATACLNGLGASGAVFCLLAGFCC